MMKISMAPYKKVFLVWILIGLFPALACGGGGQTPTPVPVTWDPSPNTLIIEALHNNGFPSGVGEDGYTANYIPHARVYGDGRIIWLESDGSYNPRVVMQSLLSSEQMQTLLTQFVDSGFFDWKAIYQPMLPYDNPPFDTLSVHLSSVDRTVMAVFSDGPEGYSDLFNRVSSGAGALGTLFVPSQGYLTYSPTTYSSSDPLPYWDPAIYGFVLQSDGGALYIQGAALDLVWEMVNQYPYSAALVMSYGQAFQVYLQIPGISLSEPPPAPVENSAPVTQEPAPITEVPGNTFVTGSVVIEDGESIIGGTAGNTIQMSVAFSATTTAPDAQVTEMRVGFGYCQSEAEMSAAWEPFVTQMSYPYTIPLNWSGFYVSVQYQDGLGNRSPVYCDDITVEGMPPPP
jgi:hypothetical protein